jgi:hypothetical protein
MATSQILFHNSSPRNGQQADDTFIEVPKKAGCLSGGGHSGGLHSDMTILKVKSATNQGYETATEGDSINLANQTAKHAEAALAKERRTRWKQVAIRRLFR